MMIFQEFYMYNVLFSLYLSTVLCCCIFAVVVFVTSPSDGCQVAFCRQFPIRLYKQPKATIASAPQTSP